MAKKKLLNRKVRSWACANIILDNGLFDEFKVFEYSHPKIKSKYRLANLFLLKKKLLYKHVDKPVSVNMDTLEDYYWDYTHQNSFLSAEVIYNPLDVSFRDIKKFCDDLD